MKDEENDCRKYKHAVAGLILNMRNEEQFSGRADLYKIQQLNCRYGGHQVFYLPKSCTNNMKNSFI